MNTNQLKIQSIQELISGTSIEEVLRTLAEKYPGKIAFSTSFGLEDQVLTHIILSEKIPIRIFSLDTGRLFNETYFTQYETNAHYGTKIETYFPDHALVEKLLNEKGPYSFLDSIENRKECCHIRKVIPLQRALKDVDCWITGIRSDQGVTRKDIRQVEFDETHNCIKVHPLLNWSLEEVKNYIKENNIPYNELHDKGYPSIGCAPCTRAIKPGEDVRAGRWWWESSEQKECGLHFTDGKLERKNKPVATTQVRHYNMDHLKQLEAEAIYILREVASQFEKPALLFSGGKDSITLVRLAEKAFRPGKFPFPLVHIDTGHNFPETIEFRDEMIKRIDERLIIRYVQDSIDRGRAVEEKGKSASRNVLQTVTLLDTIEELKFDACIGGARRDEEKARAKERIFSIRDDFGQWDPKLQRPELWNLYNGLIHKGENVRVFPISNWTELDVWMYIQRENIPIPSIYFTHRRNVVMRDGVPFPVSDFVYLDSDEKVTEKQVRFRTVGDMTCTAAVESDACNLEEIISEIISSRITERGSRLDDKRSEAAMEDRKRGGYF